MWPSIVVYSVARQIDRDVNRFCIILFVYLQIVYIQFQTNKYTLKQYICNFALYRDRNVSHGIFVICIKSDYVYGKTF